MSYVVLVWVSCIPFMGWLFAQASRQASVREHFGARDAVIVWAVWTMNWPITILLALMVKRASANGDG